MHIGEMVIRFAFVFTLLAFSTLGEWGSGRSPQTGSTTAMFSDQSAATFHLESANWGGSQTQREEECAIDPQSNDDTKTALFEMDPESLAPIPGQAAWPVTVPDDRSPTPSAWASGGNGSAGNDYFLLFAAATNPQDLLIEKLDMETGEQYALSSLDDPSSEILPEHTHIYSASEGVTSILDGSTVSLPEPIGGLEFIPDLGGEPSLLAISRASNPATLYRVSLDEAGRPTGWISILSIEMPQWTGQEYPQLTGVTRSIIAGESGQEDVLLISFDNPGNSSGDGIVAADMQSGRTLEYKLADTVAKDSEEQSGATNWFDPMSLHALGGSIYMLAHTRSAAPSDCAPRMSLELNGPEHMYFRDQTEFELTLANSGGVTLTGISLHSSLAEYLDIEELFLDANHGEDELPVRKSVHFKIPFTPPQNQAQSMIISVSAIGNYYSQSIRATAELPLGIRPRIPFSKTGPDVASGLETIEYRITLENTTTAPLTDGSIIDEKIGYIAQLAQPLFHDDFNTDQLSDEWISHGLGEAWQLQTIGSANSSLQPNLIPKTDNQPVLFLSGPGTWEDYSVLIDLRTNAQAASETCVGFRLDPIIGAGYYMCAHPDQEALRLWKADTWYSPSSDQLLVAEAKLPLTGNWHHLRTDLLSAGIRIYWDGNLLIDAHDDEFKSGTVALVSALKDGYRPGDIQFDNLVLSPNPAVLDVDGRVTFTVNHIIPPGSGNPYINAALVYANSGSFLIEQETTHELKLLPDIDTPPDDIPLTGFADLYEIAEDDTLIVPPDQGVLSNDGLPNPKGATAIIGIEAMHGSLQLNANGSFIYTPHADYFGPDTFTYRASNGRATSDLVAVQISILPVNDPPNGIPDQYRIIQEQKTNIGADLGVLANDSDPEGNTIHARLHDSPAHGLLELSTDGAFSYIPNPDFIGEDRFTYLVDDGEARSNPVSVVLQVEARNQAPIASDDHYLLLQDVPFSLPPPGIAENDRDPDGDPLIVLLVLDVEHGEMDLSESGHFTFTPDAEYTGPDQFVYRLTDGSLESGVAIVTLSIEAAKRPPTANDDEITISAGGTLNIAVLENDFDPDGDQLYVISTTAPEYGSLTIEEDGSLSYTADVGYVGAETLQYAIQDGSGGQAEATLTIHVIPSGD